MCQKKLELSKILITRIAGIGGKKNAELKCGRVKMANNPTFLSSFEAPRDKLVADVSVFFKTDGLYTVLQIFPLEYTTD